ncbi:MAG: DUF3305 domain-containing protein [Nitratireductor sp.]|nr:DUF3305 domain-containing protein [Nitratireductor sp.]
MPIGVVVRRLPGVTRWAKWVWKPVALLPGAGPADWKVLRAEGDAVEYHAGTADLVLHRADTEAYRAALTDRQPSLYVVMAESHEGSPFPYMLKLVTASPYEGQAYGDPGSGLVEKVAMPPGVVAWVAAFIARHHEEERFVKRKRDGLRMDGAGDGVGDARIEQMSDVYRAPAARRKDGGR